MIAIGLELIAGLFVLGEESTVVLLVGRTKCLDHWMVCELSI